MLDPNKTFAKASDNSSVSRWYSPDPLAFKYFSLSPYNFVANNPIKNIDPDGRQIVGESKDDANKAQKDILAYFKDDKFAALRNLITVKGRKFNKIDAKALDGALKDVKMSDDEKALVNMVTNTINSKDEHVIEYAQDGKNVSSDAASAFKGELSKVGIDVDKTIEQQGGLAANTLSFLGGAGVTVKTDNGTFSVVIEGLPADKGGTDYQDVKTGAYGTNPTGMGTVSGHEIFGHGRSLALGRAGSQQADAIQTENLILRVMGQGGVQRDGTGHGNGEKVTNPSQIPGYQ